MGYLSPQTQAPARPGADELRASRRDSNLSARILYLRSYLLMRAFIGVIGIALPVALLLVDGFIFEGTRPARGSLSAYYYSGMRDVFVGSLCAIAVFLVTYKVFEHNLDNTLSIVAGVAALGVALFPTGRAEGSGIALSPLQDMLGEAVVETVHYVSAVVFILSLGVISFMFGVREGRREGHEARWSPTFWQRFHWGCAGAIGVAVVYIAVTQLTGVWDGYSLIIGESVAVFAFGLSWLTKGLELNILLGPDVAEQAPSAETTADAL